MSEKAIHYGVLVGALAVAGFVFLHGGHGAPLAPPRGASLLDVIPRGAALELTCDFARLRKSPLGALAAQQLSRLSGGGDLTQRCGFDPLALIDQLALGVPMPAGPEAESLGDFALLAAGPFHADAIAGCAERLISDRGGEPTRSSLGSLSSVRDRKGSGGEVAVRDGGPLIVSGGSYFRELADLANLPAAAAAVAARNPRHAALRQALGEGTVVVSWLVPEGWFGRVADDERAKVSALAAVNAVGLRVDLASDVQVTLRLETADEPTAERVSKLLAQLKETVAAQLPDPLLTSVVARVALARDRAYVTLKVALSVPEAETLLARASDALGPGRASPN